MRDCAPAKLQACLRYLFYVFIRFSLSTHHDFIEHPWLIIQAYMKKLKTCEAIFIFVYNDHENILLMGRH